MLLKREVMKIGRHENHSLKSVDAAPFVLMAFFVVFLFMQFVGLVGFWYPYIVSHTFPDELFVDSEVVIVYTK
jgi:hypothetical protein